MKSLYTVRLSRVEDDETIEVSSFGIYHRKGSFDAASAIALAAPDLKVEVLHDEKSGPTVVWPESAKVSKTAAAIASLSDEDLAALGLARVPAEVAEA